MTDQPSILDQRTDGVRINYLYIRDPMKGAFEYSGNSYVLDQLMEERGWTNSQLRDAIGTQRYP